MFPIKLGQFLKYAQERLKPSYDAEADAVLIAEECLSLTRSRVRTQLMRELTAEEEASLMSALEKRAAGEPVQYIFGRAPFMGYEFFVDRRVLIPRMDTENLCEAAYN